MTGKTQSIVFAGALCGMITALVSQIQIPFVGACLCCLAYVGAGAMAIWHYSSSQAEDVFMTSGEGAGMGALAGVVAALVAMIVGYLLQAAGFGPDVDEVISQLYEAGQFDEEQLEAMENFIRSPLLYVGAGMLSSLVGAILGALGGALGASRFATNA